MLHHLNQCSQSSNSFYAIGSLSLAMAMGVVLFASIAQAGSLLNYGNTSIPPTAIRSRPIGDSRQEEYHDYNHRDREEYNNDRYGRGDRYQNRHIENTILVRPVIIDSTIENSTLINPILVDRNDPWSRFHSVGGRVRPSCTILSHQRVACQ